MFIEVAAHRQRYPRCDHSSNPRRARGKDKLQYGKNARTDPQVMEAHGRDLVGVRHGIA